MRYTCKFVFSYEPNKFKYSLIETSDNVRFACVYSFTVSKISRHRVFSVTRKRDAFDRRDTFRKINVRTITYLSRADFSVFRKIRKLYSISKSLLHKWRYPGTTRRQWPFEESSTARNFNEFFNTFIWFGNDRHYRLLVTHFSNTKNEDSFWFLNDIFRGMPSRQEWFAFS